jgi:Cu(I)/Ag(I) efflux system membrane protein CusA/SilA
MRDGAEAGAVGATVPLGEVARVVLRAGPPMIRDEGGIARGLRVRRPRPRRRPGRLGGRRAPGDGARDAVWALPLPPGTWLEFTGQYQELARMEARMKLLVPMALLLVVLLLYAQFRNVTEVLIVLLSVPFALVGSVWALYLLDYRLSTAVWVGVIALVGLAAQTGVVMIVYIDHAYLRRPQRGEDQLP